MWSTLNCGHTESDIYLGENSVLLKDTAVHSDNLKSDQNFITQLELHPSRANAEELSVKVWIRDRDIWMAKGCMRYSAL